jgi:Haem-containing dehydratase
MSTSPDRRAYAELATSAVSAGEAFAYWREMICATFVRLAVGCYANRYLRVDDEHSDPVDKSFGMSRWRSLADLDRWAKDHPTHKAIFGQAMKYLSTMGPAARLRLYHEVTIAAADEQAFEYLNCHPDTGMLRVQLGERVWR